MLPLLWHKDFDSWTWADPRRRRFAERVAAHLDAGFTPAEAAPLAYLQVHDKP